MNGQNRVKVPKRIRYMIKAVDQALQANEGLSEIKLQAKFDHIVTVAKYCSMFDYCKLVSTIQVPSIYPDLAANVCQVEY